ncbi:MAG: hypothetical protein ABW004_02240 [Aeromicrobium sp.]
MSSLAGFRRRVRRRGEWSLLPLFIGAPIVVWELIRWMIFLIADADGDPATTWRRFVDSPSVWWTAAAVVLLLIARVSVVLRIRREFRWFRGEGWVGFQAPTGWVVVESDGPSSVVHDHRAIGGDAQYRSRQLRDPIVLVSAPHMPAAAFVAVLDQVRAGIVGRLHGADAIENFNKERKNLRAVPAGPWFTAASGCFLGESDDRTLTAAIPRPLKGGRRTRLASIKLTKDEADVLSGGVRGRSVPEL